MLVTFISQTGNIKRFVKKLPFKSLQILEKDLYIKKKCIFITYTTGIGEVPKLADNFCSNNKEKIIAIASSGNRNWGTSFAAAADILSKKYNIPVISKFELSGHMYEVENFIKKAYLYFNKQMQT